MKLSLDTLSSLLPSEFNSLRLRLIMMILIEKELEIHFDEVIIIQQLNNFNTSPWYWFWHDLG